MAPRALMRETMMCGFNRYSWEGRVATNLLAPCYPTCQDEGRLKRTREPSEPAVQAWTEPATTGPDGVNPTHNPWVVGFEPHPPYKVCCAAPVVPGVS